MSNLIQLHIDAFLALARGDADLADDVFEGEVKDRPSRYASVWPNTGLRGSERLDLSQIQLSPSFTVHSIGTTPEQARWVADRITPQLLNVRPVITDRSCWPIRLSASQPLQKDPVMRDPQLWFFADVFTFTSTPK